MSDLKLTIDKELIMEYRRDFQIGSLLEESDDTSFKCYTLNRIFTKFPERKELILKKSDEFDWVEVDVMTGQILQYNNNYDDGKPHLTMKPVKRIKL